MLRCFWLVGINERGQVGVYLINGLANGILDALEYPTAWAIPESGTPATQKEVDNAKATLEKAITGLQTLTADKTPVSNGDTTVSVKTGDDVNMLGTLGLISSLGVIAFLKKKKRN